MLKECRPCWFCLPFDLTAVLPGVPVLPGCSGQSDRSHCRLWNLPVCVTIAFLNPVCSFFSSSQDSWLPMTDIQLTLACLTKKKSSGISLYLQLCLSLTSQVGLAPTGAGWHPAGLSVREAKVPLPPSLTQRPQVDSLLPPES